MLICKAFPNGATQSACKPLTVTETIGFPIVVPEIKLRQITVQMALSAMLKHTLHATLEDAEIAFNRVRVDSTTTILALAVVHDAMREIAV